MNFACFCIELSTHSLLSHRRHCFFFMLFYNSTPLSLSKTSLSLSSSVPLSLLCNWFSRSYFLAAIFSSSAAPPRRRELADLSITGIRGASPPEPRSHLPPQPITSRRCQSLLRSTLEQFLRRIKQRNNALVRWVRDGGIIMVDSRAGEGSELLERGFECGNWWMEGFGYENWWMWKISV